MSFATQATRALAVTTLQAAAYVVGTNLGGRLPNQTDKVIQGVAYGIPFGYQAAVNARSNLPPFVGFTRTLRILPASITFCLFAWWATEFRTPPKKTQF